MPNIPYRPRGTFATVSNIHLAVRVLKFDELKVYLILCDRARDVKHPGLCWPSQRLIGEETDLLPPNISRAVSGLLSKGFITKQPRLSKKGRKIGNSYQILQIEEPIDELPEPETTTDTTEDYGY